MSARWWVFGGLFLSFLSPANDGDTDTVLLLSPNAVREALNDDYEAYRLGESRFPSHALNKYVFHRLNRSAVSPQVADSVAEWLESRYPEFPDRPIDALYNLSESEGTTARLVVVRWLSEVPLTSERVEQLAMVLLTRESSPDIREETRLLIQKKLDRDQIDRLMAKCFEVAETPNTEVIDTERFLAVKAVLELSLLLPDKTDLSKRLLAHFGTQDSRLASQVVRSMWEVPELLPRSVLIEEVLKNPRFSDLAKSTALQLIDESPDSDPFNSAAAYDFPGSCEAALSLLGSGRRTAGVKNASAL